MFSSGNSSGDANYGTWWFWLGLVLIVVILLLVGNLERSRVGRAWVAIREDEDAAEVMGVNTFRFKLWAFVIGAAIGGLSGALYAGQVQYVAPPSFNIINSMLFLCAVVLGGQGNKLGVIFGAFIIVYLPNRLLGVHFLGINMGDLKYLFFGLALVVMMIFRPEGLFPARQQLLAYGKAARDLLRSGPAEKEPASMTIEELAGVHREIHAAEGEVLLETKDLTMKFGGLVALDSVTFNIRRGEILGLIGPNGAGKTTCFNAITGVYRPSSGIGDLRRRAAGPDQTPPDHPQGHRPHLPEHPAVGRDDGAGERRRRHRRAAQDLGARRAGPHAAPPPGGEDRRSNGPRRCCISSASPTAARRRRRTCPTAISGGSRSPARWRPSPNCCASTSRPPGSTRARRPH